MAARTAHMVRQLDFAAVGTLDVTNGLQGVMSPAHVAAGLGSFLLRNGHFTLLTVNGMAKGSPFNEKQFWGQAIAILFWPRMPAPRKATA
jgi:hypothetical protein